jgi:hypothetical protein
MVAFGIVLAIVMCMSYSCFAYAAFQVDQRIMEPRIEIYNLHTIPDIVRVNETFYINATVLNNSTNKISLDFVGCGGSPLSAIFDKNVKIEKRFCNALFISHTDELLPQQAVTVSGPDYLTVYRAINPGSSTANVTLKYNVIDTSSGGNTIQASKSKTFTFNVCLCLPPTK